jgi:ATP-dependent Clp protease ATP-binding subunit ClpC
VPALHVRNVPEELYEKLRSRAEREGSINGEAIAILEEALSRPSPTEARALMTRMFRRRRPGPGGFLHRFTHEARAVVARAQQEARTLNHPSIGTEHLALGLFGGDRGLAGDTLASLAITEDDVRARIPEPGSQEPPPGRLPFQAETKRVLELSLREALALGHAHIGTEHILLGLLRDENAPGGEVLRELGADHDTVRAALAAAGGPPAVVVEFGEAGPLSWEYRVEDLADPLDEALESLASELRGWELVSVTGQPPELRAILKRRAA